MEVLLLFIKHHFGFLWEIIESINGLAFSLIYKLEMDKVLKNVFEEFQSPSFSYKRLTLTDIEPLYNLLKEQDNSDKEYFRPHDFNLNSLYDQLNKKAFLMMGAFNGDKIIGYFFLRFFVNKKCFVGRLISKQYRGQGIGLCMNKIMYETAWRMNFRCLSTISRKNDAIMRAHARNPTMIILKELQNDYLLVEFIRKDMSEKETTEKLKKAEV